MKIIHKIINDEAEENKQHSKWINKYPQSSIWRIEKLHESEIQKQNRNEQETSKIR